MIILIGERSNNLIKQLAKIKREKPNSLHIPRFVIPSSIIFFQFLKQKGRMGKLEGFNCEKMNLFSNSRNFKPVNIALLTVSDTKNETTDKSSLYLANSIKKVVIIL